MRHVSLPILCDALPFRPHSRLLGLCLVVDIGGGMWPLRALRALRSLWLVSPSVLPPPDSAGSLEGGLSPDGRKFSSCDCGRSMAKALQEGRAMFDN